MTAKKSASKKTAKKKTAKKKTAAKKSAAKKPLSRATAKKKTSKKSTAKKKTAKKSTAKKKTSKKSSAKKTSAEKTSVATKSEKSGAKKTGSRKKSPVVKAAAASRKVASTAKPRPAGTKVAPAEKTSARSRVKVRKNSKLTPSFLLKIREQLLEKKFAIQSHLESERDALEKSEKRHRADLEEMASDTHDADSLCEIMDMEASQIEQINRALNKIENGTYGICEDEDCDQEIGMARLEALPFATQCVDCKRRSEMSHSYMYGRY